MTVGVVSHFHLARTALCGLLNTAIACQVILDIDDIQSNIEKIRGLRPRILLIDVLNCLQELANVRLLKRLFSELRILLLLENEDTDFALRAIEAGAHGCLSKNCSPQLLAKALNVIDQGQLWISHEVASLAVGKLAGAKAAVDHDSANLTERESEVLALLALGHGNKEIASEISISENTIKAHLASIYRKLHVTTRLEAALRYFEEAHRNPRFTGHKNLNTPKTPIRVTDSPLKHLGPRPRPGKNAA